MVIENVSFSAENSTMPYVPDDELTCSLFNGNEHQCNIIIAVKRTVASISMIGCLFMITVIWLFKKYQIFSQRLILYLTISALCTCIMYIMADLHPDGPLCNFQAWGGTFFDWTVMLWVCCLTFNLYMNAVRETNTERFEWAYHLVCWGVSFAISLLPFIGNHYGPAGMWCWIVDDWKWRFGIWYCPLFLIITGLFFAYVYIIFAVDKKVKTWGGLYDPDVERRKQRLKEDVKPLKWYPFVYLAVSVFPLINRIQNAVSPDPVFGLVLMHAISAPMQGAVNAIVFGLDKDTRSRLTFSQIKAALLSRRQRSIIREYPIERPPQEPTSVLAIQSRRFHDQSLIREYPTSPDSDIAAIQPHSPDDSIIF